MQLWILEHAALIGYSALAAVSLLALWWGVKSFRKARRPKSIEVMFSVEKVIYSEPTWDDYKADLNLMATGGMTIDDFTAKWSGKLPKRPEKKKVESQKDPWAYQNIPVNLNFTSPLFLPLQQPIKFTQFQNNEPMPVAPELLNAQCVQTGPTGNRLIMTVECSSSLSDLLALWHSYCKAEIAKREGTWFLEKEEQSCWQRDRFTLQREYVRIIPIEKAAPPEDQWVYQNKQAALNSANLIGVSGITQSANIIFTSSGASAINLPPKLRVGQWVRGVKSGDLRLLREKASDSCWLADAICNNTPYNCICDFSRDDGLIEPALPRVGEWWKMEECKRHKFTPNRFKATGNWEAFGTNHFTECGCLEPVNFGRG